jgi:hypothetical protein
MKKLSILLVSLLACNLVQAQPKGVRPHKIGKIKRVYFGVNMDSYLLSSSTLEKGGGTSGMPATNEVTVPRFTGFLHIGTSAHYNFSQNFGLVSGLGIKNIGLIEKINNPDSTVIRRNYTIGIPLGIKFGNMFGTYGMIGGGVDIPFWYKEKGFVKRNDKDKINEWFSQRSATVLPYVFVGARFHPGMFVKATYYPTNFMNADYATTVNGVTVKPYDTYNVNLFMLSLGFDISYRPKHD